MDKTTGLQNLGKRFEEVEVRLSALEGEVRDLRRERSTLQKQILERMGKRFKPYKDIPGAENRFALPEDLWEEILKNVQRHALNLVIEAGKGGIFVTDLAPMVGYNPKGVGGLLNAVRKAGERAGLDPDEVLKSKRVFHDGKDQSLLLSNLQPEESAAPDEGRTTGAESGNRRVKTGNPARAPGSGPKNG